VIGKALNGIVTAIIAFIDGVNWSDFGAKIVEGLKALIETFDFGLFGEMVRKAIDAILDALEELTDPAIWAALGQGLAEFFNEAISFDWDQMGRVISQALNGIVTAITEFIDGVNWSDFGKKITDGLKAMIAEFDFGAFGEMIRKAIDAIIDALEPLTDPEIWAGLGDGLAEFFNEATSFDWEQMGTVIMKGLNGILTGIVRFFQGVNWSDFGKKIVTGLNGMVDEFDPQLLADALSSMFNAAVDILFEIAENFNWESAGEKIAESVNGTFEKIDWEKTSQAVSGIALGLLRLLNTAIEKINWKELGDNIKDFLANIKWDDINKELSRLIGGALEGLADLLGPSIKLAVEAIGAKMFEGGGDVADGFNRGMGNGFLDVKVAILEKLFGPVIESTKEAFGINSPSKVMTDMGGFVADGFLDGVKSEEKPTIDFFDGLRGDIESKFEGVGPWFSERWHDIQAPFDGISEWFDGAFSGAYTASTEAFSASGEWFGARYADVQNAFEQIGSWFPKLFGDAWNGISDIWIGVSGWFNDKIIKPLKEKFGVFWDGVTQGAKSGVNGVIESINGMINGIFDGINGVIRLLNSLSFEMPDWMGGGSFGFNFKEMTAPRIPKLAKGGIVSSPTLAMIGEAGDEAVLPLENNGGWMDALAAKIAGAMAASQAANGGLNGGPTETNLYINDTKLASAIFDALRRESTRRGVALVPRRI
jgi:hypothetical protein